MRLRSIIAALIIVLVVAAGLFYFYGFRNRTISADINAIREGTSDTATTTAVKTALALNKQVSTFDIHVATNNNIVTLTGQVPTDNDRKAAEDIARMAKGAMIASMQPTHATSDGPWAEARLGHGTARQKGAYAWRQVLDAGVPLACGSDFPVEDIDPRKGLYSAETRKGPRLPEEGWMPEQRMTRLEALACFTAGAAYAEFAEDRRGALRVGMDADLTAFDRDVMSVPADELIDLRVTHTFVGGRDDLAATLH